MLNYNTTPCVIVFVWQFSPSQKGFDVFDHNQYRNLLSIEISEYHLYCSKSLRLTVLAHLALVLAEHTHEFWISLIQGPHLVAIRGGFHHTGHTLGVLLHVMIAHTRDKDNRKDLNFQYSVIWRSGINIFNEKTTMS